MAENERILNAEFDCVRAGEVHFVSLFGLEGISIPAGHKINYTGVLEYLYERILLFDRLRIHQFRKSILYNRRMIINIWLDDELIFTTESEKFRNINEKLKFNNSESSKVKFRDLLEYMLDINFNPAFPNDNNKTLSENLENSDRSKKVEFTDYQKAKLLESMQSGNARKLAKIFFSHQKWQEDELIEANKFLENALKKYGSTLLLKLLALEKLPTRLNNVKRVFTFFDKKKLSSVRIALDENSEFIVEKSERDESISFINHRNKVYELKKDGSLKSFQNQHYLDPTLALFISFIDDPLNQIIYFGAETKRCSFCNLPLEDPKSLEVGYGKRCAETHDIPWG